MTTEYPQIAHFMYEVICTYGDMTVKANRDKAFPNTGMADRKLFDEICTLYYDNQPKPQEPKKK
jgi:hypothetical protein